MSISKKYYIHSIIGLVIMFGFGLLPTFGPVTPYGMKMLGILIGLIYLWSFVEMGWPSVVALVAYVLTGGTTMDNILATGFGNSNVLMVVFASAFAFAIADQGVFDKIAKWFLINKLFRGKPWVLSFGLIILVFILASCYAGIAVLFIIWTLLPEIGKTCGLEKQHPWYAMVVVGTTMAMVMAQCTFPWKPMVLFVSAMAANSIPLGQIPMLPYIAFMMILNITIIVLYLLIMKFIVRIDLSGMKNVDVSVLIDHSEKLTKHQKICLAMLALFIIGMIVVGTSGLFADSVMKTKLQSLTIVGVAMLFFAVGTIYHIDGKPLINIGEVAKNIPWDTCVLLAVVTTFCGAVATQETGVSALFAQITAPILAGHSTIVFAILVLVVALIATNFLNNTVVMVVMLTIVGAYVPTLSNLNFLLFFALFLTFTQIAFLLPASSIWGGLAHSQANMCNSKNIYIAAIATMVAAVLSLVIAFPVGNIIL